MPEGIRINQITARHAKEFHEKLKARGMATTTIHKRIQFARQFMHDAVDWKGSATSDFQLQFSNSPTRIMRFLRLTRITPLCTSKRSVLTAQFESELLTALLVLRTGIPLFGFGLAIMMNMNA